MAEEIVSEREQGIIKWFCPVKKYGFVTRQTGEDCFILLTDIVKSDRLLISGTGAAVEFKVFKGDKGLRATEVKLVQFVAK